MPTGMWMSIKNSTKVQLCKTCRAVCVSVSGNLPLSRNSTPSRYFPLGGTESAALVVAELLMNKYARCVATHYTKKRHIIQSL